MSRLRIGLDCDGVLYNFDQYVRDQIQQRTGVWLGESDITHWTAISDCSPEVKACFETIMDEESCWYAGNPYQGARELIQRLAAVSDVYIVTHITRVFLPARKHWLELNGFPFTELIDAGEKWREVQKHALDAMIDDKYENCLDVAEKCMTSAFLVSRPWNSGRKSHPLITRGPLELAVSRIEAISQNVSSEIIAA